MDIIVVSSGKGGVGKTTTSASLASGFAMRGKKVAIVDFDVGLRNVDLIMGCERKVVYDLLHVMQRTVSLKEALVEDKNLSNLFILAAPQTCNKSDLQEEDLPQVFKQFEDLGFDTIICDSPAGLDKGSQLAMKNADKVIMVVNAEISSLRDADKMLSFFVGRPKRGADVGENMEVHIVITRYRASMVEEGKMISAHEIQDLLAVPVIGIIPESYDVLNGSNSGNPVILNKKSDAGLAYQDTVARMQGQNKPFRFLKTAKKSNSWFKKLFKFSYA